MLLLPRPACSHHLTHPGLGARGASSRVCRPALPRLAASRKHGLQPAQADSRKATTGRPLARQQPQPQRRRAAPPPLPQLLAGCCAAAAAGLFGPLLPSWAFDSLDYVVPTDTGLDPGLGDSPQLLDTLLVVVVTYLTVMLLYLWLSSFMAGEEDAASKGGGAPGANTPPDQADLPPGYNSFLNANVRSYVGPDSSSKVSALRELGQAQPLEGEDLEHLKGRLAAGAAEALEVQLRECERLVHSKLLARKLGYHPTRPAAAAAAAPGSSSNSSSSSRSPGAAHLSKADVGALMTTAVMTAPGGLSSWQHRAAVEALIDAELDDLLPPGGGRYQEDLVVRQVMRRLVGHLVMEESLLLLEGTQRGRQALEAAGGGKKGGGAGPNPWALW